MHDVGLPCVWAEACDDVIGTVQVEEQHKDLQLLREKVFESILINLIIID